MTGYTAGSRVLLWLRMNDAAPKKQKMKGGKMKKKSVSIKNEMFSGGICYIASKDLRPRCAVCCAGIYSILVLRTV